MQQKYPTDLKLIAYCNKIGHQLPYFISMRWSICDIFNITNVKNAENVENIKNIKLFINVLNSHPPYSDKQSQLQFLIKFFGEIDIIDLYNFFERHEELLYVLSSSNETILHFIAGYGYFDLFKKIIVLFSNNMKFIYKLDDNKYNIMYKFLRYSPCHDKSLEFLKYLLNLGISPVELSSDGLTCSIIAIDMYLLVLQTETLSISNVSDKCDCIFCKSNPTKLKTNEHLILLEIIKILSETDYEMNCIEHMLSYIIREIINYHNLSDDKYFIMKNILKKYPINFECKCSPLKTKIITIIEWLINLYNSDITFEIREVIITITKYLIKYGQKYTKYINEPLIIDLFNKYPYLKKSPINIEKKILKHWNKNITFI